MPHISHEAGREEYSLITHQGSKKYWAGLYSYMCIGTYNVTLHGSEAKESIKDSIGCVYTNTPKSSKKLLISQGQKKSPIVLNKDTY